MESSTKDSDAVVQNALLYMAERPTIAEACKNLLSTLLADPMVPYQAAELHLIVRDLLRAVTATAPSALDRPQNADEDGMAYLDFVMRLRSAQHTYTLLTAKGVSISKHVGRGYMQFVWPAVKQVLHFGEAGEGPPGTPWDAKSSARPEGAAAPRESQMDDEQGLRGGKKKDQATAHEVVLSRFQTELFTDKSLMWEKDFLQTVSRQIQQRGVVQSAKQTAAKQT
eukprot:m.26965 g.26965  ORF g.26965 m.26965 type:complete len:225 (-) comp8891_c0_seq1:4208-4882(-)